jgi:hypothetical protein
MGMQQAPRPQRSPWVRYAPFIAIVVVIAVVAVILVAVSGGDDKKKPAAVSIKGSKSGANGVPLFYNDAKAKGEAGNHTWQDHCDTATGRVAIPILNPPPCVEKFTGDNGGATSKGVTADTIKIGYYIAKPDPIFDVALRQTGAYDPPDDTAKAWESYAKLYASIYELYGRKVEMVRINGTGAFNDAVAARADADRAASQGVFAVVGGPPQARQFAEELAAKHVLCIATCIIAQPEKFVGDNAPYLWPPGPSPDQTSAMVTELIKKQLLGKPAEWAGPDQKGKDRTFTLLTYDTPDAQFKPAWDDLAKRLKDAGANIVAHVDYYLNFNTLAADARTIAAKLKKANATSIVFTGDPVFPASLTKEMTTQGYFPEWVMSGTVLADTNVFARSFDQQQWAHAFGLQLTPAKLPKDKQDAFTLHQWWYGTPPPTDNNFAIEKGAVEYLMLGLQLAGPKLTPEQFKLGMDAAPLSIPADVPSRRTLNSWGDHGLWPGDTDDLAGLDNAGILWWDPNTSGPDETGTVKPGVYRGMNGGLRYTIGHWPTEPLKLFDPADTVFVYTDANVPPELLPVPVPMPPDAPAAKK